MMCCLRLPIDGLMPGNSNSSVFVVGREKGKQLSMQWTNEFATKLNSIVCDRAYNVPFSQSKLNINGPSTINRKTQQKTIEKGQPSTEN